MVAACRTQGDPYAIPQFDLASADVEGFLTSFVRFMGSFRRVLCTKNPERTLSIIWQVS